MSPPKDPKKVAEWKRKQGINSLGNKSRKGMGATKGSFKKGQKGLGRKPGFIGYWTGKKRPDISQRLREVRMNNPNRIFKDTGIEIKVEQELIKRGINYQKQVPLCKIAIVDFYLPEHRIVIQCDGDYWHNLPESKIRDEKQDNVLYFNGFNVYRFWEHDINKSVEKCLESIGALKQAIAYFQR